MKCHCGRELHYANPALQRLVESMTETLGEFVHVTVGGRTWLVQRHYIALHGLRGVDVATLGFREVARDVVKVV